MVVIISSLVKTPLPKVDILLIRTLWNNSKPYVYSKNASKKGKRIAVVINKPRTFPFAEGYALCHFEYGKNRTMKKSMC